MKRILPLAALILAVPAALTAAPTNKPPLISITAVDAEGIRAETRLASFIRALQLGRRDQAAALLSSRATPAARQALTQKRWLPTRPTGRGDVYHILYWPDLQIRTQNVGKGARSLMVGPRSIPYAKSKFRRVAGFLEVRMVREQNQWRVDLPVPRAYRQ